MTGLSKPNRFAESYTKDRLLFKGFYKLILFFVRMMSFDLRKSYVKSKAVEIEGSLCPFLLSVLRGCPLTALWICVQPARFFPKPA